MAPGIAGTISAFDLRFDGHNLVGYLEEVRPSRLSADGPLWVAWDTIPEGSGWYSLLGGAAYVSKLPGYSMSRRTRPPRSSGKSAFFWDQALRPFRGGGEPWHGAALILILPPGFTLASDLKEPIFCNAKEYARRFSAKEADQFKGRIAVCFLAEVVSAERNLRTSWRLAPMTGSVHSEIERINSIAVPSSVPSHFAIVTSNSEHGGSDALPAAPSPPTTPSGPDIDKTASRTLVATWVGIAVALLIGALTTFSPEFRKWVGLDQPTDPPTKAEKPDPQPTPSSLPTENSSVAPRSGARNPRDPKARLKPNNTLRTAPPTYRQPLTNANPPPFAPTVTRMEQIPQPVGFLDKDQDARWYIYGENLWGVTLEPLGATARHLRTVPQTMTSGKIQVKVVVLKNTPPDRYKFRLKTPSGFCEVEYEVKARPN